jgi:hypothetical protein
MTCQFECDPLTGVLSGTMQARTYERVPMGPDIAPFPTTLIRTDQDWAVKLEWSVNGPLLPLLLEEFEVRVYIEDLTPLENEYALGPVVVPTSDGVADPAIPGNLMYTKEIRIGDDPAWNPDHPRIPKGVYQITALVQLHNVDPARPWPVAAFETLPIINIYQPV